MSSRRDAAKWAIDRGGGEPTAFRADRSFRSKYIAGEVGPYLLIALGLGSSLGELLELVDVLLLAAAVAIIESIREVSRC